MKTSIRRNGFTMIELLFVIVIMGVVGGFALDTVRQYYENIFRTHEYTKQVADADHILEQLSKYFETAINASIVNLDETNSNTCYGTPGTNNGDFTVAFVAVDNDSLRGINGQPGWSEDTLLQNNNILSAPDADYTAADTIITALYPTSDLNNSAVYDADSMNVNACTRFNWNGGGTEGYHRITGAPTATTLPLVAGNIATDGKQKYLMRTAYAFRVLDNGDFKMYSNFRPWLGETYTDTTTRQNLLGQNVAHFSIHYNAQDFQNNANINDRGMIWKLKICMTGIDANLSESVSASQQICRERSVHVRY
ncbi:MAG: type II secretion system GspH family protein [Sulfuricurvum sp.]|jgi:prepilin-type N-terminal cleavage/methylation domain-containing protein|uniref:type II secretion system protein n=1 Tax=Sulfuricurvum sp. TaxID=2025608 RepID=UPI0025FCD2AE|nr:type II secretion system protein [Sulfuricurvum sp.]MCK9371773.1 type II secretion system GspH family protein [Sulfuricurvum sp.]